METKYCKRCDTTKPLSEWSTSGKKPNGEVRYATYCKPCKVEYNREKYHGGRTAVIAKKTETHRECMHCHKMLPYSSFSKKSSYCAPCFKERFPTSPETVRARTARYRAKHHERWKAMHRIHQFNRKSLIKATDDGTVTDAVLKDLLDKTHCCWCEKETPASLRTIEHIKELSQGGHHSAHNLDMACLSCNSKRLGKLND